MKMRILILLSTLMILNSCSQDTVIHITPQANHTEGRQYMGDGAYVNIPSGFQKPGASYKYQSGTAWIDVEVKFMAIAELKQSYQNIDSLNQKGVDRIEFSPVVYDRNEHAFFAITLHRNKQRIEYVLAIDDGNKVYNILASCAENEQQQYDEAFREALFSTYLKIDLATRWQDGLFYPAYRDQNRHIYTRDKKHPTSAKDSALIEVLRMKENLPFTSSEERLAYVRSEVEKLTGKPPYEQNTELFGTKAEYTYAKGENGRHEVIVVLMSHENHFPVVAKGHVLKTADSDLKELQQLIRNNFSRGKLMQELRIY